MTDGRNQRMTGPQAPVQPRAAAAAGVPYGVEHVIRLMDLLPLGREPLLVMQVVRLTLESAGVKVPQLIDQGEQRLADIANSIAALEAQVTALESQVQSQERRIAAGKADLAETIKVRGYLLAAGAASAEEKAEELDDDEVPPTRVSWPQS